MKVTSILLCLALVHYSAGSIFQHRSQPSRFNVDTGDYVNHLQQKNQLYFQNQQYAQNHPNLLYKDTENFQKQYLNRRQPLMQINRFAESTSNEASKETNEDNSQENLMHKASTEQVAQQNLMQQWNLPYADVYAAPLYADMDPQTQRYALMRNAQKNNEVFGDVVAWKGLQMAVSPKWPITKYDIKKIFYDAQMSMKHVDPETKTMIHNTLAANIQNNKETKLDATEMVQQHQYPVEKYNIKTQDGYVLTLIRIQGKQEIREEKQKPVVFLMHDLLGSADDWVLMGPQKSLAYLLADAGYDVWLGNARSTRYSHHVSKHRAQSDYWLFNNDDIALYDLPAMIDYVLLTSKQQKMVYIGHGFGTTTFFALVAARPEYNNKIVMMYALSPMTYMTHVRSPIVRMIAPTSQFSEQLQEQLGYGEFKPSKEVVHTIGGAMCENEIGCKHLCSNVYVVMSGITVQNLNGTKIPSILSHLPAGASIRQMKQYGQALASNEFRMYDYGSEVNQKVYGEIQPPQYQVKKVTTPVALYFSQHDWLAHPKDVERLQKELPNVVDTYQIPADYFSHMDFQFAKTAPELVYDRLIESIKNNTY